MGKWTPNYTDDVLHAKISNLVSGAIRRVAVERESTTTITYENFVTDLDTGDSFTASLIDILVKEIADRRARPSVGDRTLLSDRTVGNLRSLSRSARSYPANRFRSHGRRSVPNLPDYLVSSSSESVVPGYGGGGNIGGLHELDAMMVEDEDEDFVIDLAGGNPGAGSSNGLWDAGGSSFPRRLGINPLLSSERSPSPVHDDWQPLPLRVPPTSSGSGARWGSTIAPSTLLSRQPSIRRAARRGVDLNDSSAAISVRRRYSTRDGSPPEGPETVTEPREGLPWSRQSFVSQPSGSRRFFPFPQPRNRHHDWTVQSHSRDVADWSDRPPWNAALADEAEGASSGDSGDGERGGVERVTVRAPRLRRGGVLPPETIAAGASRRASPVYNFSTEEIAGPTTEQVLAALDSIPGPTTTLISAAEAPGSDARPVETAAASDEPAAYPTPGGSTEGENVS